MYKLSLEQAQALATVFSFEEIKNYSSKHRAAYDHFCAEEAAKAAAPIKRRNSRTSAISAEGGRV
jgi:hypothetical protein